MVVVNSLCYNWWNLASIIWHETNLELFTILLDQAIDPYGEFFDNGKQYLPKVDTENDKDDEDW